MNIVTIRLQKHYDGGVKNRAVHFHFRWQRISRTVDPRICVG